MNGHIWRRERVGSDNLALHEGRERGADDLDARGKGRARMAGHAAARVAMAALGALALAGAYGLARFGAADEILQVQGVETADRALRLARGNAGYWAARAEMAMRDGKTALALESMGEAVQRRPSDAFLWEEYGADAEAAQELGRAEECLRRAVGCDRRYGSRLLLAEFYARRKDAVKFWPAMRAALATAFSNTGDDELADAFDACWGMADDPAEIAARAMPRRADVLGHYLDYLAGKKRMDLTGAVAERTMAAYTPGVAPALLRDCDRLLEAGQVREAAAVWNGLAARHGVEAQPLRSGGAAVTNGQFRWPLTGEGFEWKLFQPEGIYVNATEGTGRGRGQVRFEFTGKEAEQAELMDQYVALPAGRRLALKVEYETRDLAEATGLRWELDDLAAERGVLLNAELRGAGKAAVFPFETGPETEGARLRLRYERSAGTVRAEGVAEVESVELSVLAGTQ